MRLSLFSLKQCIIKQLLDSVFVISGIIKVSAGLATSTSVNNCYIILMVIFAGLALKQFQSIFILAIFCNRRHSLLASSPIWASEASRGRKRERATKRVTLARLLFTISSEWRACSQTTAYRKQFQCRNIVLNNKTGPLFLEFN